MKGKESPAFISLWKGGAEVVGIYSFYADFFIFAFTSKAIKDTLVYLFKNCESVCKREKMGGRRI